MRKYSPNLRPTPALRRDRWRCGIALTIALTLLTACGNAAPTASPSPLPISTPLPTATATAMPTAVPATPTGAVATPSGTPSGTPGAATPGGTMDYPEVIRRAIAHLARDQGIAEGKVEVVSYERKEWPDSSLGCPEPGKAYLTVITPGYRVSLKAEGKQFEYHTNEQTMVIRCPK